jgi:hypothetical protein
VEALPAPASKDVDQGPRGFARRCLPSNAVSYRNHHDGNSLTLAVHTSAKAPPRQSKTPPRWVSSYPPSLLAAKSPSPCRHTRSRASTAQRQYSSPAPSTARHCIFPTGRNSKPATTSSARR